MNLNKTKGDAGFIVVVSVITILVAGLLIAGFVFGRKMLIQNRANSIVKWCRKWESAELTYYFKRDKLAGDTNNNGIIADEREPVSPVRELINANVMKESGKKVMVGDQLFYMKIGHDTVRGKKRNVFVICPSAECNTTLEDDAVELLALVDELIDGEVIVAEGDVRGVTGVTLVAEGEGVTDVREATVSTEWDEASYVGAAYYFEDYQH